MKKVGYKFSDEVEKNAFEGGLIWLFRVLNRENIDKARKNLRIEALNEEEWKVINTAYRSLGSVPQVIEETCNNVNERLGKLGLDEYIDQLTKEKDDLREWIKKVSLDLEQKLEIKVGFIGRKGLSPQVKTLSQLTKIKADIIGGRGAVMERLNSYQRELANLTSTNPA